MTIRLLRAKIHRARVTATNLDYEGSITIASDLLAASGILPYEEVQVVNLQNGVRFTTYAIPGETGEICLNGAAARLAVPGDQVIIMAFASLEPAEAVAFRPSIVTVDEANRPTSPLLHTSSKSGVDR